MGGLRLKEERHIEREEKERQLREKLIDEISDMMREIKKNGVEMRWEKVNTW